MEIVISRYNEDLTWVTDLAHKVSNALLAQDVKFTIYNKGSSAITKSLENIENVDIIHLPNVGVCDHTYLHHIVHRYDTLSRSTMFLPGSAYKDILKRERLNVLLKKMFKSLKKSNREEITAVISMPSFLRYAYVEFSKTKQIDSYECSDVRNRDGSQVITLSEVRPFGAWYDKYLKTELGPIKNVSLKGMFIAGREKLLKRSHFFYKTLLDLVDKDRFPEASHFVERSWHSIIQPTEKEEISLIFAVPYMKQSIACILLFIVLIALCIVFFTKPAS
jgi:hypothetical protein